MHNIKFVAINDSINDGGNRLSCFYLIELLSVENLLKQLAALHQVHDKAVMALVLESVYHLDYVGMVNLFHDVDLCLQTHPIILRHLSFR